MILTLRRRHRRMVLLLAVVLPPLLAIALALRRPVVRVPAGEAAPAGSPGPGVPVHCD